MYFIKAAPALRGLGAPGWQDTFLTAIKTGAQRTDPDLGDMIGLATEIISVERQPGGALDPRTPSTFKISDLRTPMKAYLFYRKHPLATYAIPAGILALAFLIGRASAR